MPREITCILLALGLTAGLFGQSATIRPAPSWRLGDKRQVEVRSEMRIQVDTITMNSTSTVSYQMEVTRARKDGYELNVRSGLMDVPTMNIGLNTGASGAVDSLNNILQGVIKAMYEPFSKWNIRYRLDRSGKVLGRVEGTDDKHKLIMAMQQAAENAFAILPKSIGDAPVDMPTAVINHMVDSLYTAFLEVQVNQMNYFLKIYSTDFPLTGSLRQPVLLEDIQAPIHTDFPKLPGVMEAGLDKNDDAELIGRTITTYDPDALFAAMQALHQADDSMREGLYMIEECVERFDKRSSWLTRSTASTRMRMGPLKMDLMEYTQLTAIR